MTLITGNTYPVKDKLREMGGKWDSVAKAWLVPEAKAEEARALVESAPKSIPGEKKPFKHYKCVVCGAKAWNGGRGRFSNGGVIIYRSGECQDCYEERKMGY